MLSRRIVSQITNSTQRSFKRGFSSKRTQLSGVQKLVLLDTSSTPVESKSSLGASGGIVSGNSVFKCNIKSSSSSSGVRYYSSGKKISFMLADVGEGIAECEVLKWYFKEGDSIKEFDRLCDVQSDKATVEITSRYDGIISKIHHEVGAMAKVGSPLIDLIQDGVHSEPTAHVEAKKESPSPSVSSNNQHTAGASSQYSHHDNHKVLATPSVRHMAKVNKINLHTVAGSGKDGRILKEDIVNHLSGHQPAVAHKPATPSASHQPITPTTPISTGSRETKVPITGIRKIMVKSMTAAAQIPHFGYCEDYNMDRLIDLRAQLKPLAESRGVKLSYLPFIIKAASLALLKYPILNSSLAPSETEIIYKNYHNIGVAMDTPQGLIVPNIKNVESKSIFEIALELNRLQKLAVEGHLTPADLTGGTFTLSNIGTIGGTYASPVLVLPEVCIGAIGKMQKLPRFDKHGNVVAAHITPISWSGDHRVIDGATIANFSNLLKNYMENPNTMLMDTK